MKSETERFFAKVKKTESCWEWTAGKGGNGYGAFNHAASNGKRRVASHRWSYAYHFSDPGSLHVLHKCDNPICVNPDHLFLGTHKDNMADMGAKGRSRSGEQHHDSRLSDAEVAAVREILKRFPPEAHRGRSRLAGIQRFLARWFGVSQSCISKIWVGKRKQ